MSARNRWLGLIFLALAAITLAVERPWQGDAHARTAAAAVPLFPALQRDVEIGRVHIQPSGGGAPFTIEKVLDRGQPRWVVTEAFDHPADLRKLGLLIESLRALRTRNLEGTEESSHATFGIREGEAVGVDVWSEDGESLAQLRIGRMRGQDVMAGSAPIVQFYVRDAASPQVYRTDELYLPPEETVRWCDTRFLRLVEEDAVRFLVRTDHLGDDSWRIVRDPDIAKVEVEDSGQEQEATGRWRMVMPEPAVTPDFAGDSFVFTLLGLEAAAVLGLATTPEGAEAFGELTDTLELGLEQGSFRLDLGRVLPDNRRAARVHGLPHLYALEDFEAAQLQQTVDAMR